MKFVFFSSDLYEENISIKSPFDCLFSSYFLSFIIANWWWMTYLFFNWEFFPHIIKRMSVTPDRPTKSRQKYLLARGILPVEAMLQQSAMES